MVSDAYKGNAQLEIFRNRFRQPVFKERDLRKSLDFHERMLKRNQKAWHPGKQQQQRQQQQIAGHGNTLQLEANNALSTPEPEQDAYNGNEDRHNAEHRRQEEENGTGPQPRMRTINDVLDYLAWEDPSKRPAAIMRLSVSRIVRRAELEDTKMSETWSNNRGKPIDCQCEFRVSQKDTSDGTTVEVLKLVEDCTVTPLDSRSARVELDDDFFVKETSLRVFRNTPVKTYVMAQNYTGTIHIRCVDATARWPPIPVNPVHPPLDSDDTLGTNNCLLFVANLDILPSCPPKGALIQLESGHPYSERTDDTGLAIEIDCAWNGRLTSSSGGRPPPLRRPPPRRLPTPPPVLEDDTDGGTIPTIRYTFRGALRDVDGPDAVRRQKERQAFTVQGFCCPWCDGKRFSSLERLHYHLMSTQLMNQFIVKRKPGQPNDIEIQVEVSREVEKVKEATKDAKNIYWEANTFRPFNLKEYLDGDRSWIEGKTASSAPKKLPFTAVRVPKKTGDARPIPPIVKKRWPVPARTDGHKFVRSRSKRWIEPGEELSESDIDVDEEWLIQRHRDTIDDFLDLSLGEKMFMKRWARHIFTERPEGYCHFSDSMERFVDQNLNWIKTPNNDREFWKFGCSCVKNGSLDMATFIKCLTKIKGGPDKWSSWGHTENDIGFCTETSSNKGKEPRVIPDTQSPGLIPDMDEQDDQGGEKMDIDVQPPGVASVAASMARQLGRMGISNEQPLQPNPPRYCFCNDKRFRKGQMIACANNGCKKSWFHKSCVGLESFPTKWICPDCS